MTGTFLACRAKPSAVRVRLLSLRRAQPRLPCLESLCRIKPRAVTTRRALHRLQRAAFPWHSPPPPDRISPHRACRTVPIERCRYKPSEAGLTQPRRVLHCISLAPPLPACLTLPFLTPTFHTVVPPRRACRATPDRTERCRDKPCYEAPTLTLPAVPDLTDIWPNLDPLRLACPTMTSLTKPRPDLACRAKSRQLRVVPRAAAPRLPCAAMPRDE
jgi:hypothetical protein